MEALTPEDRRRISEQLEQRLKTCSVCGSDAWGLVDVVEHQVVSRPLNVPPETPFKMVRDPETGIWKRPRFSAIPTVAVVCTTCGQVLFFSAKTLGLMDPPASPPPEGGAP